MALRSNGTNVLIPLPEIPYGYRTTKISWEELVNIVTVQKDLAKLSRSADQQREYEIYKKNLLDSWKTVGDYVLCDKFPNVFDARIQPNGKKLAHPALSSVQTCHQRLVQNDFPYYTEPDIEHWVLWKIGGDPIDEADVLKAKAKLQHCSDVLHWINPTYLQSLPELDHAHLLGRNQNKKCVQN